MNAFKLFIVDYTEARFVLVDLLSFSMVQYLREKHSQFLKYKSKTKFFQVIHEHNSEAYPSEVYNKLNKNAEFT